jgi:hypothetical protein
MQPIFITPIFSVDAIDEETNSDAAMSDSLHSTILSDIHLLHRNYCSIFNMYICKSISYGWPQGLNVGAAYTYGLSAGIAPLRHTARHVHINQLHAFLLLDGISFKIPLQCSD